VKRRVLVGFFSLAVGLTVIGSGCATVQPKDYTKLRQADPHSILIVPAINNSHEVGADNYFLATVSLPLAEQGYYVFPVNMTKELLTEAGLNDPGLVHQADPRRLGELFGADAILYIAIDNWEAQYLVLSTTVTVGFSYILRDASSGEELWSHHQVMQYTPQNRGTGNVVGDLIAAAVSAAVTKAAPNYLPLARQANSNAFQKPGQGLPPGPHDPAYGKTSP
jgi:hypothetical protein